MTRVTVRIAIARWDSLTGRDKKIRLKWGVEEDEKKKKAQITLPIVRYKEGEHHIARTEKPMREPYVFPTITVPRHRVAHILRYQLKRL